MYHFTGDFISVCKSTLLYGLLNQPHTTIDTQNDYPNLTIKMLDLTAT